MAIKNIGKTMDMTVGNPLKIILIFAIPVFVGSILQNFYNLVDTAIAGNILGDGALAAIGSTSSLYNMVVSLAVGMNTGFSLLISRAFGSQDNDGVNRAVAWTLTLNLITTATLMVGFLVFLTPILHAMNTPEEVFNDARLYMMIILAGIPLTMAYNMEASLLRSLGNSLTPLIYLVISSVLNLVLNLTFVLVFDWGVSGLAFATVLAQGLSAAACFTYIRTRYPALKLTRSSWRVPRGYVSDMFLTGLSMGMMSAIVSVGSTVLQSAVNKLGSTYVAGQIAGSKIEVMLICMVSSVSNSIATYASQNFGASQRDRIRKGVAATFVICAVTCTICAVFALTPLATLCMRLVTGSDNPEVIASGAKFVRCTLLTSPGLCVLLTLRNTLQGMGHKVIPLFASAMEMGGKLLFGWILVPRFGYTAACYCEPSLWVACSIFLIIIVMIYRGEFRDTQNFSDEQRAV